MINSLKLYSYFYKEIRVVKKGKLNETLRNLVDRIDNDGNYSGKLFRPTPDPSRLMLFLMSPFLIFFLFLMYQVTGGIGYIIESRSFYLLFLICVVSFFMFYYSFFTYWIGPWWLKKNLDKYFIYIGDEGIVRKDWNVISFVPWDIVTGVMVVMGVRASGNYVELEIKGHATFNPKLIKGTDGVFADWIDYAPQDRRELGAAIKQFIKE
jgi:hypothetical protein